MTNHRKLFLATLLMLLSTSVFAQQTFFTTLSGANEPDGGDPDASGLAVITISGNTLNWQLTTVNTSAFTGAHIHRLSSSAIVVGLGTNFANGIASGTVTADATTQAIFNEIIANPSAFYVNVHSTEKPGGAVRGTLTRLSAGGTGVSGQESSSTCVDTDIALCLNGNRFKVEATWSTPTGNQSGQAKVVKLTQDSGYLWFFNASNVEATVKVLNACNPFNAHWVFASGLTNVQVVLKVTDTQTGRTRTYTNPNGTAFLPIQDTQAFTCP